MTADRVRRGAGLAGIIFAILAAVALALPGSPPKADEASKITGYFSDKHDAILAGNYMIGVAFAFFQIFAGALRTHLGGLDREGVMRPGAMPLGAAAAATALTLAGVAILNGPVFYPTGDDGANRLVYFVGNDVLTIAAFPFAAFFWGMALSMRTVGGFPSWLAPAALAIAALNLLSGIALFVKSGFFGIGGAFAFIVPLVSLLWILAVSATLLRPARAETSAAA
jgi:hypothetical protein